MKTELDEYGEKKLTIENEDDFCMVSNAYKELMRKALPIARTYLELKDAHPAFAIDEDDLSLDSDGDIQIHYETGGRGYYDDETMYLPSRYLFDTEWQEQVKAEVQQKKEEKAENDRIAKEKHEKAEVERARKEYHKLRNRFEGES